MRQEAKVLIGKKDFKSFMASDPALKRTKKDKNTIRKIKNIIIRKNKDLIQIKIEADGFLYKMVRNIVGTLLDIGRGKISKGGLKKILTQKNRRLAGHTADAKGLCLLGVKY